MRASWRTLDGVTEPTRRPSDGPEADGAAGRLVETLLDLSRLDNVVPLKTRGSRCGRICPGC
nr:hypothetical protein [Streptomyces sp. F001]